jgi:lichenan operon transcriptional antiterminator
VAQEAMYLEDSRQLLEKLHESLNIDFSSYPYLKIELAKHLRGMHYRLKYGLEKRDVGILESKGSNPAFEYAVLASYWLSEKLDKPIQETEIVFLSYRFYMHFQLMSFHKKSNVLVVLSNGKNTADLFVHELLANFGKYIDCAESAEFYEIPFIDVEPYDCILTDIPAVQFDVNIDVKRVNYFFTEQDHIKLKNYFTHTQVNSKNFIACFDERLFFKDIEYDDKHEIIQFMLNEIKKNYTLDADSSKQIELREKLSSTERGNGVAIPHTLTVMAEQPIIAMGITKRPFLWDKEVCQLVILVINGRHEAAPFLALSIAKAATGNIELVYDLIKSDAFEKAIYAIEQFVDHFEFY